MKRREWAPNCIDSSETAGNPSNVQDATNFQKLAGNFIADFCYFSLIFTGCTKKRIQSVQKDFEVIHASDVYNRVTYS